MSVRRWSLLVWTLVGVSAAYWALKLVARAQALPAQTTLAATPELLQADLSRLAGSDGAAAPAAAAPPVADARLVLVGVVSPPAAAASAADKNPGLALIAVDGKPPQAFAVGAVVDGGRVLQRVSPRTAHLGLAGQPAQWVLSLAPPPEAARAGAPGAAPQAAAAIAGNAAALSAAATAQDQAASAVTP